VERAAGSLKMKKGVQVLGHTVDETLEQPCLSSIGCSGHEGQNIDIIMSEDGLQDLT
jgi:hypothetical protein